jgi:hypothetical protein
VVFKFKRRLGYYLFHTYLPTCLIVIMSWISFWIKPEAVPARVTLGVTSLLTLSTQHANSQKSLPPVSYIKVIFLHPARQQSEVPLTDLIYKGNIPQPANSQKSLPLVSYIKVIFLNHAGQQPEFPPSKR